MSFLPLSNEMHHYIWYNEKSQMKNHYFSFLLSHPRYTFFAPFLHPPAFKYDDTLQKEFRDSLVMMWPLTKLIPHHSLIASSTIEKTWYGFLAFLIALLILLSFKHKTKLISSQREALLIFYFYGVILIGLMITWHLDSMDIERHMLPFKYLFCLGTIVFVSKGYDIFLSQRPEKTKTMIHS